MTLQRAISCLRHHRLGRRRLAPALVSAALLALLAAAPVAGATTDTQFSMSGRGWGHGIGMCQYGAQGYALHGWTYQRIITHYYTGVTLGKTPNSTVRVLLNDHLASTKVTSAAAYTVVSGTVQKAVAAAATTTITRVAGKYHIVSGTAPAWDSATPVLIVPASGSFLHVLTADQNHHTGLCRGKIRVIYNPTGPWTGASNPSVGLSIINELPLESYLYGVVPWESPAAWKPAALEAQAVAARSYAASTMHPTRNVDVYCTTASQMYGGRDAETAATNTDVNATRGVVPLYGGKPITAYFFSTSGGHTENIENVWQGASPVAYLKGVVDAYDSISPLHVWPENPILRPASTLAAALGFYSVSNPSGVKGILRAIYVIKRGTSPRVVKALVVGDKGTTMVTGGVLRIAFGLRDTWVYIWSMSLSPAPADKPRLTYGIGGVTLSGDLYPGRADKTPVLLHYYRAGAWKTIAVASRRVVTTVSVGTAKYSIVSSRYSYKVAPPASTKYFFSYSSVKSPATVVSVRPAIKLVASATSGKAGLTQITFSGTVKPVMAGRTISLQTRTGSGTKTVWKTAGSAVLTSSGTYSVAWTAAAGVNGARMYLPSGLGLASGFSSTLVLTIT
jgi:stage II sporulation protein D